MKHLFLIRQYFIYLWKAQSAHGIHSPYVFDFIETVLKDKRHFYAFDDIRTRREELLSDQKLIQIEDLGAGSHLGNTRSRRISDIAKTAIRTPKFGQLLFRIVEKYQLKNILELGTSLGIGTAYLALAAKSGKLITIEGSTEIAAIAKQTFDSLSLNQIRLLTGNFDAILPELLAASEPFDLIFIDGNHTEEATIRYFQLCSQHANDETILIFDDIHWSRGMHKAWQKIQSDPRVRMTIDLFFIGLVFFKKEFKEKQHFILKF